MSEPVDPHTQSDATYGEPPAPPPYYATYGSPLPPPVPPRKRRTGLIVGGVVAALVLVGGGVAAGMAVGGNGGSSADQKRSVSPSPSYSNPASDVPTLTDPTGIVGTPAEELPASPSTLSLGAALSLQSTNSNTGDVATADVTVYGIQAQATSTNEYEKPSNGQYVKVDVGTTGTSAASFPYNAYDFVLQDKSGQIYQPTFAAGFDPAYNSGNIAQNQTVRGFVVFDIPAAAMVMQVSYQVPSGVLGSWPLP